MTKKDERDEYLEQLWYMKEEGKTSVNALKRAVNGEFDEDLIDELSSSGLVESDDTSGRITLTGNGEAQARRLIRAHRIAERLLHDVFGGEFERAACEFEHTLSPELVDSICTLLGHPRICPHGLSIPEGECCRRSETTTLSFIIPFTDLKVGRSARIAYLNCQSDRQMHKLEGLCIQPGAVVKVHQTYPTYVIECEGASIALDKEVVSKIFVWKDPEHREAGAEEGAGGKKDKVRVLGKIGNFFSKNNLRGGINGSSS